MSKAAGTLLALLVLVGGAVVAYLVITHDTLTEPIAPIQTGQAIFSDGEHGFTVQYPDRLATDFSFTSFYHLPASWRADALPDVAGTPLIAIIGYRTESDHSFPRYYSAEVRIGASNNPTEVERCLNAATDHGETELPDMTLNGTPFKVFSFQSAGMMQYVKGVSYRAVHEGSCIAIEKIAAGSNYRDDPESSDDISQEKLDAEYANLDAIISTFTFVR